MTPALRARALVLREGSATQTEIAEKLDISRQTLTSYLTRGRAAGASSEAAEFATKWDQLDEKRLSEDDLVRLLEAKARKGTTIAILALLQKPWRKPVREPSADTPLAKMMRELNRQRGLPTPDGAEHN